MSFKYDSKRVNKRLVKVVETVLRSADREGNLPITQVGEEVLRNVCPEFKGDIPHELMLKLIKFMKTTMHNAPGVGLAAPQIGLNMNFAIIEDESVDEDDPEYEPDLERETSRVPFYTIINPSYTPVENTETPAFYEGCLSFQGYYAVRVRYREINAIWTDEKGRDHAEVLTGWPARIFQHETDHLSGEIYIDQAIIRSLTTTENLTEYNLDEDIYDTARRFDFEM